MNTIQDLKDKVCVITGGANGIGLEMARRFLSEGANVVIADIDEEAMKVAGENLNGGDKLLILNCDISTMENNQMLADRTVERFGKVNIVCLNAALLGEVEGWRASDLSVEAWRKTLATNLDAHFYGVKAFMPHLQKEEAARIIFTASSFTLMSGLGDPAPYFVGQYGLMAWAECLYWDLEGRPDNTVGLSILLVGNTKTGIYYFLKDQLEQTEHNQEAWDSSLFGSRDYVKELIDHFGENASGCDVVIDSMVDAIRNDTFYVKPNIGAHWDHIEHRFNTIREGRNPSYYKKTIDVYRSLDADG